MMIVLFFCLHSQVLAAYHIVLENGAEFYTHHYWEENGQIMFYARGGIIGVERSAVKRIENSDMPSREQKPEPVSLPAGEETPGKPSVAGEKSDAVQADIPLMMAKKKQLDKEIAEAEEAFGRVRNSGNEKELEKARNRLSSLLYRESQLFKEAKEAAGGKVPDWWNAKPGI